MTAAPLYWRVLRLRTLRPNGWQRALLVEGVLTLSVVLTLSGAASAWAVVVVPLSVAALVKAHDVLGEQLAVRAAEPLPAPSALDYAWLAALGAGLLVLVLTPAGSGARRVLLYAYLGGLVLAYATRARTRG